MLVPLSRTTVNLSKPLPPMEAGDTLETQATMADSQVLLGFMFF